MSSKHKEHFEKITPLSEQDFNYVLSHFINRKFKKNQYLVQQGDPVLNDFYVVSGLLKASFTSEDDKEHILQFAMEDWWVSDYQAYFNQTIATLNIVCIEDVEVLSLSLTNREKLCAEMHKIEHFFRKKSNFGYIALQRRILSMMMSKTKERYEQLLLQYPTLFQRVPKTLIASYLGVSREVLSRISS